MKSPSSSVWARAQVTVTLSIDCGGPWGPDCTVAQVQKQATDHALATLNSLPQQISQGVRIVGEPRVAMIVTEDER
jgi:hypothetical protein